MPSCASSCLFHVEYGEKELWGNKNMNLSEMQFVVWNIQDLMLCNKSREWMCLSSLCLDLGFKERIAKKWWPIE